jgi:hypothetical protein
MFTGINTLPIQTMLEDSLVSYMFGNFNMKVKDLTELELAFFNVFKNTYYTKTKFGMLTPSKNLLNIQDFCLKNKGKVTYWTSFVECWARIFEGWVQWSLKAKGIENRYLVTPEKKFEIQVKVIDGREIKVEEGRKVYPLNTVYPKINSDMKKIINIFART